MISVKELAEELDLSDAGVRYRINKLGCKKIMEKQTLYVSEPDAFLVRDFWKGRRVRKSSNPTWVLDFIAEVKDEMHRQCLTQNDIAEMSGFSQSMIVHCLNNYRKMSDEAKDAIAYALGMRPVLCLMELED